MKTISNYFSNLTFGGLQLAKIFSLIFAFSIFSLCAHAVTIASEGHRSGSLPAGWSQTSVTFTTSASARENLRIAYTSLHGTSIKMVPKVLEKAGYTDVNIVPEQAEPNGNFPTVLSPNPEEPEALTMALALADKINADIVFGTDPDSDRLGVAVRNNEGKMILLNGNQTMILMTAFLLEEWKKAGKKFSKRGFFMLYRAVC